MKRRFVTMLLIPMLFIDVWPRNRVEVVPRGNWAKVRSLSQHDRITLRMKDQRKLEARFLVLEDRAIRLQVEGVERVYPKSMVQEIRLLDIEDSTSDGTLIGVGVGFAGGFAFGYAWGARDDFNGGVAGVIIGSIGAGIGSLVGYFADRSHQGTQLIYRSRPRDDRGGADDK